MTPEDVLAIQQVPADYGHVVDDHDGALIRTPAGWRLCRRRAEIRSRTFVD